MLLPVSSLCYTMYSHLLNLNPSLEGICAGILILEMKTSITRFVSLAKQKLFYQAPAQRKLSSACREDELRKPMCAVKACVKRRTFQGQSSNC